MLRRVLQHMAGRMGYKFQRLLPPVDMRASGNDPRQWLTRSGSGVLVAAPLASGRIRFFPLRADANPFVRAVALADSAPDPAAAIQDVLADYYAKVQPRHIYAWTGLDEDDAPGLSQIPPWAVPEPWIPATIAQKTLAMHDVAWQESRNHGPGLTAAHGDKGYGPVSTAKLHAEAARLCQVWNSIRRMGYRRHGGPDGDIETQIFLREDGEWRWEVSRGLHRAAVLAARGIDPVPIRVKMLIYRHDAGIWPNVQSGLYTRRGAEKYFDRIFDGITDMAVCPAAIGHQVEG